MSIQRRQYEQLAKHNQEKVIQEGPPHQNPLKTTFGGTKDAKNTPSMQRYYDKVKADQAARAVKTAAEREKERLANRESVDLDELKSSTLRSYADRAGKDNQNRVIRQIANDPAPTPKDSMNKLRSRRAGWKAAMSRLDARERIRGGDTTTLTKDLAREDVQQVDEVSTDTLRSYVGKAKQNTDPNKRGNRMDGVSAALSRLDARSRIKRKADSSPEDRAISKRLASEEVEQVDELSPKTLKSYIWKAKGKVQSDLNTDNHSPKTNKRAKNVVKAMGKLGKNKKDDDEDKDTRSQAVKDAEDHDTQDDTLNILCLIVLGIFILD